MSEVKQQELVIRYLPNVKRIVNRYAARVPGCIEKDELMSAGVIGLIGALEKYLPEREATFPAYANYRIKGAIISELRTRDFLSRTERKKIREMEETWADMEKKLGRPPKEEEVATALNMDTDAVDRIRTKAGYSFIALDETPNVFGETKTYSEDGFFRDTGDQLALTERMQVCKAVEKAVEELGKKEKLVISLYYHEELTMKEIGRILNLTESRICQIHTGAMMKLRGKIRKQGLIE